MGPAPHGHGLRAVPLRSSTDALVRLGWVLLVVGLFLPWIVVGHRCELVRHHGLTWIVDAVELAIRTRLEPTWEDRPVEWWWSLPLVYGFAAPALWCSRYRQRTGVRLVAGWAWLVGLLGVLVWARASVSLDWAHMRSTENGCAWRSFAWSLQPLQADLGFYCAATGALLVGLCPVLELQRFRWILARWRARPGSTQDRQELDMHGLRRLCHPLRRLVREAGELRAALSPFRCIDGEPARRLMEIIVRLRALDERGHAELRDRGVDAAALLEALAPAVPRRESCVDEALRVDAALARLEAVGLLEDGVAPYR